jgi:uncharacterized protein
VSDYIRVAVAYVGSSGQFLRSLEVRNGTSVQEALEQSDVLRQFPEIALDGLKVGIFGKAAVLDQVLGDGDRVEIYRPLIADPKESRKRRAAAST